MCVQALITVVRLARGKGSLRIEIRLHGEVKFEVLRLEAIKDWTSIAQCRFEPPEGTHAHRHECAESFGS